MRLIKEYSVRGGYDHYQFDGANFREEPWRLSTRLQTIFELSLINKGMRLKDLIVIKYFETPNDRHWRAVRIAQGRRMAESGTMDTQNNKTTHIREWPTNRSQNT